MIRVVVFANSEQCTSAFSAIRRSRSFEFAARPIDSLRKSMNRLGRRDFVYLEIRTLTPSAIRARLKQLDELPIAGFGIVDPEGAVSDIAEVFHRGATDYLDARLISDGVSTARIGRVLRSAGVDGDDPSRLPSEASPVITPSGSDWAAVEPGLEYTFQMLYVGLDYMKEMRRKSSEALLQSVRRTLQSILTRSFAAAGGRIWVWKEDDGVLLCPFDGLHVTFLVPAIRIVLNRVLMNIEEFSVTTPISWRMGLHLGETPYAEPGETSSIVSEDLNFVFHVGERAIGPGQLVVTRPALSFAPEKVAGCFVRGKEFESSTLYHLRELA